MTTATEKMCSGCGVKKPLADYHRYARSKDGHSARCKPCVLAQQAEYHERVAAERVEPAPTDTKTCTGCGVEKPYTEYHRDSARKDGYNTRCRSCVAEKDKTYRGRNRDQIAAQEKAWREANAERVAARKKTWHAEKWATDAEFRARMQAGTTRYRRLLANAKQEPYTREQIFERDGWVCGICSEPVDPTIRYEDDPRACATIDHVVPISLGGDDTPANVQAAHGSCNYGKRDRVADEDLGVAA